MIKSAPMPLLAGLLAGSAVPALSQGLPAAEDAANRPPLEELVVTGRPYPDAVGSGVGTRLNVPLDEQPLAIQVLDGDILNQIGGARLDDLIDFAVGGAQANQFGGQSESFLFRGFSASVADDGVLQNGSVAGNPRRRDAAAIERTEILRGPGSALFGQGGPGGVVNVVRKRPTTERFFGSVVLEGSSLIRTRGEVDINAPVSDTVAVRLISAFEGGNSFRFQDAFDETFPENRQFVSPSLLVTPGERTTILLRGEYLRTETPFDRGLVFTTDGDLVGERGDFFGDPSVGTVRNEDISGFLEVSHIFNDRWSAQLTGAVIANDFDGIATEPVLIFPEPVFLPAGVPIPLGPGLELTLPEPLIGGDTLLRSVEDRDFTNTTATVRADINGTFQTGALTHHVLASVEYQHVDQFTFNSNSFLDFPPVLVDGALSLDLNLLSVSDPMLEVRLPATFEGGVPSDTEVDTVGLIFFDQIDIGERIHLLGGGRVDFVDQRSTFGADSGDGSADEADITEFSPRAGLVVEPFADLPLSLFFSWSQSFVVNLPGEFDTQVPAPQEGRVFEGGLRFDPIPDRLQVTLTGFDIEVENVPVTTVAFADSVDTIQSSRGLEVTVEGELLDGLTVLANYAFIDSDVVIPTDAGTVPGEPIPGVANHVASGLITYRLPPGPLAGLSLGAGVVYQSDRANGLTTSLPNLLQPVIGGPPAFIFGGETLDSFVRLDLFGAYQLTDWLSLNAGVQNVTDTLILQPSVPGTTRPDPGVNGFVRVRVGF